MNISRFFFFVMLSCLFIHCNNPSTSDETTTNSSTVNIPKNYPSMPELLKQSIAKMDLLKMGYFQCEKRADQFYDMSNQAKDIKQKIMFRTRQGYELINAGKNENAIQILQQLKDELVKYKADKKIIYQVNRYLSLAYMRLGETQNCINDYNAKSCIFPLTEEATYKFKKPVRIAIDIYKEMLEVRKDDYETIWLLNLAYMAIGEYPQNVPPKFLIPPSSFQSDKKIPTFQNKAHLLNLNTAKLAGGACMDDFNNDGFLDIVATSWGLYDQMRIFINKGDGSFEDQTQQSGLMGLTGGLNANHMDYNNDGHLDIFVMRGGWFDTEGQIPNSLIRNNGDGTFTDVTQEANLLSYYPTQTAVWADFNLDGWLDLFIGNETTKNTQSQCELYINQKNGTFKNEIAQSSLQNIRAYIKGVTAGDINNDGYPDLYISNIDGANMLFLNDGKSNMTPSFTNISSTTKTQQPQHSFPTWMWDYNNDGWEDIFVAPFGFNNEKPQAFITAAELMGVDLAANLCLYQNNGDNTFTNVANELQIAESHFVMGSNYGDIDNDGYLDMYLGTGSPNYTSVVPNKLFMNAKGEKFLDVTTAAGVGHIQKGHGVAFGDIDNDGDQDLFSVVGGAYEGDVFGDALFFNPFGNKNNFITLKLMGTSANKAAIGARIKVIYVDQESNEYTIRRTISTGGSFGSNSLLQEIGLASATNIKTIEIKWPDSKQTVTVFNNIEVNRFVQIEQNQKEVTYLDRTAINFSN